MRMLVVLVLSTTTTKRVRIGTSPLGLPFAVSLLSEPNFARYKNQAKARNKVSQRRRGNKKREKG
jgi:hypothetical protein